MKNFTTSALAAHIDCSAKFLRDEIAAGHLRAVRIGRGHKGAGSRFVISEAEADRYCRALGFPPPRSLPPAVAILWEAMATSSIAAILVRDGVIVAANNPMVDLCGYSTREIVGHLLSDFAAKAGRKLPDDLLLRHAEQLRLMHKSGAARNVLVTRLPLVLNGTQYLLALGKLVTGRSTLRTSRTGRPYPLAP